MCVGVHMLMCNKTTRREEQQPETDRHIDRHSGGGRRGGGEEEGKGSGIREWQGGGGCSETQTATDGAWDVTRAS